MLRRVLSRAPGGVVRTGGYQAAEKKVGLSRRMLRCETLYPLGSYRRIRRDWRPVAMRLKALCPQDGVLDWMPRPVIPGDKRAWIKCIVEALANECFWIDLLGEAAHRVRAYRKAAWAIEDLHQDLGLVYRAMGLKGLESIENVGPQLAGAIQELIEGCVSALWIT